MRTLFRYFAVGAFIAFVSTAVLIAWLIYRIDAEEHLAIGEREHVALARVIQNYLEGDYLLLLRPEGSTPKDVAQREEHLQEQIQRLTHNSSVIKLKLFDLEGNEVFASGDSGQQEEPDAAGRVRRALKSKVYSALVTEDRHAEFGADADNVFQTYFALHLPDGEAVGVLELYSDITNVMAEAHREATAFGRTLGIILLTLYVVLLLIVRRGDLIIAQRDRERTEYLARLERAKREAEAGSRAKSEFLANVSHEVRTPMNIVLGTADLLMQTPLDPKQRQYLKTITDSGETLTELIDDILNLSSAQTGNFVLREVLFRPGDVLEKVRRVFEGAATARGLTLHCQMNATVEQVRGDSAHLYVILSNLVDNAIRFTQHGRVSVVVDTLKEDESQVSLCFGVADTGIGIPQEQQQQVFEAFSQVDGSTTRPHPGLGLGLAIVRRLVEQMGGELEVTSRSDEGSKFSVVLPFKKVPQS